MEERERCHSFVLSRTPHETKNNNEYFNAHNTKKKIRAEGKLY
jgi:hypothetical protein